MEIDGPTPETIPQSLAVLLLDVSGRFSPQEVEGVLVPAGRELIAHWKSRGVLPPQEQLRTSQVWDRELLETTLRPFFEAVPETMVESWRVFDKPITRDDGAAHGKIKSWLIEINLPKGGFFPLGMLKAMKIYHDMEHRGYADFSFYFKRLGMPCTDPCADKAVKINGLVREIRGGHAVLA